MNNPINLWFADLFGINVMWIVMIDTLLVIGLYCLIFKLLMMAKFGIEDLLDEPDSFPKWIWILVLLPFALAYELLNFIHLAIAVAGVASAVKDHRRR